MGTDPLLMTRLLALEGRVAQLSAQGPTAREQVLGWPDHKFMVPDPELPYGLIVMWSGATPPTGWVLCDGTNGTPDLRGRFIVGYDPEDDDYDDPGDLSEEGTDPGETGGFKWHGQTENNHNDHRVKHYHAGADCFFPTGGAVPYYAWSLNPPDCDTAYPIWCGTSDLPTYDVPDANHDLKHYGPHNTDQDTDNRPPFYVLAFIMHTGVVA